MKKLIEKIKASLKENPDLANPPKGSYQDGYRSATINILALIEAENLPISDVGHTCVSEYEVSKREILQSLKMSHDNLTNRKYKNATMGIGIMIRMLEREMGI